MASCAASDVQPTESGVLLFLLQPTPKNFSLENLQKYLGVKSFVEKINLVCHNSTTNRAVGCLPLGENITLDIINNVLRPTKDNHVALKATAISVSSIAVFSPLIVAAADEEDSNGRATVLKAVRTAALQQRGIMEDYVINSRFHEQVGCMKIATKKLEPSVVKQLIEQADVSFNVAYNSRLWPCFAVPHFDEVGLALPGILEVPSVDDLQSCSETLSLQLDISSLPFSDRKFLLSFKELIAKLDYADCINVVFYASSATNLPCQVKKRLKITVNTSRDADAVINNDGAEEDSFSAEECVFCLTWQPCQSHDLRATHLTCVEDLISSHSEAFCQDMLALYEGGSSNRFNRSSSTSLNLSKSSLRSPFSTAKSNTSKTVTVDVDYISEREQEWLKLSGEFQRLMIVYDDCLRFEEVQSSNMGRAVWQLTGAPGDIRNFRGELIHALRNYVELQVSFSDPCVCKLFNNTAVRELLEDESVRKDFVDQQKNANRLLIYTVNQKQQTVTLHGRFDKCNDSDSPGTYLGKVLDDLVAYSSLPIDPSVLPLIGTQRWQRFITRITASTLTLTCVKVNSTDNSKLDIAYKMSCLSCIVNTEVTKFLDDNKVLKHELLNAAPYLLAAVDSPQLLNGRFSQMLQNTLNTASTDVATVNTTIVKSASQYGFSFSGCRSDFHSFRDAVLELQRNLHCKTLMANQFNSNQRELEFYLLKDTDLRKSVATMEQQRSVILLYSVLCDMTTTEYGLIKNLKALESRVQLNTIYSSVVFAPQRTIVVTVRTFVNNRDMQHYDETWQMDCDFGLKFSKPAGAPPVVDYSFPEHSSPSEQVALCARNRQGVLYVDRVGPKLLDALSSYCKTHNVRSLSLLVDTWSSAVTELLETLTASLDGLLQLVILCDMNHSASRIVASLHAIVEHGWKSNYKQTESDDHAAAAPVSAFRSLFNRSNSMASPSQSQSQSTSQRFSTRTAEGLTLEFLIGDITQEKSDVLVNVTQAGYGRGDKFAPQGALMVSVYRATGKHFSAQDFTQFSPSLLAKSQKLDEMRAGDVWQSDGGNLRCSLLLHISLPNSSDAAFRTCFDKAMSTVLNGCVKNGFSSISFPLIGTGQHGLETAKAATYLMDAIYKFSNSYAGQNTLNSFKVRVVGHLQNQKVAVEYENELKQYKSANPPPLLRSSPSSFATWSASASNRSSKNDEKLQFNVNGVVIKLRKADITKRKADALVNSTSVNLDMRGGISKSFLQAGGAALRQQVAGIGSMLNDMEHPYAVSNSNGQFGTLQCKHIIHISFPKTIDECKAAIKTIVKLAEKLSCYSVAIPAFGSGNGKLKIDDISDALVSQLKAYLQTSKPAKLRSLSFLFVDDKMESFSKSARNIIGTSNQSPRFKIRTSSSISLPFSSERAALPRMSKTSNKKSTLQFVLTGINKQAVDSAAAELQNTFKDKWQKDTRKTLSSVVCNLPQCTLRRLEAEHCVLIDVAPASQNSSIAADKVEVRFSGVSSGVDKCYGELLQEVVTVTELNHAKTLFESVQWLYAEDGAQRYLPYDIHVNVKLEEAHRQMQSELVIDRFSDGAIKRFKVNLTSLTETEQNAARSSNASRRIIRKDRNSGALPVEWARMNGRILPTAKLDARDRKYRSITQAFLLNQANVLEVWRIQNETLYKQFEAQRHAFKQRYESRNITVIKELYHGTPGKNVDGIVANGFNSRYSGNHVGTVYGHGTYFSDKLSVSIQYASPDSSGKRSMLICDVLIGQCVVGNQEMKALPPISNGTVECYDTAVDKITTPSIYVKFHDAQVYPLYIVYFRM